MKQQKINRQKKKECTVIRNESRPVNPKYANAPVRTVHFVEVGDMSPHQLREMSKMLAQSHDPDRDGIHYVLPIRNGKIGPDIVFEEEWLKVVHKTCEVNENGEIVLKGGAKDVLVIRDKI